MNTLTLSRTPVLVIMGVSGSGKSTVAGVVTVSYTHLTLPTNSRV